MSTSSTMFYGFLQVGLYDGRWASVPGIDGPVRTGPRGNRYWEFIGAGLIHDLVSPTSSDEKVDKDDVKEAGPIMEASSATTEEVAVHDEQRAPGSIGSTAKIPGRFRKLCETMDASSYDRQVSTALAGGPHKIATLARVNKIATYLEGLAALTDESLDSRHKNAYDKIRNWVLGIQQCNVRTEDLQESQVVAKLETFLNSVAVNENEIWIEEELTVLMRKWKRGDLECDPYRGLTLVSKQVTKDKQTRTHYVLDKDWHFYQNAHYFGEGELVNGQTWLSRLALMRDGVHGEHIGGIAGTQQEGAYSVVVSHPFATKSDRYANIDNGDVIEYMGTALKNAASEGQEASAEDEDADGNAESGTPTMPSTTACTATMKKSLATGKPVRVIRKFMLVQITNKRPEFGYRYDGMYKVVKETLVSAANQEWRFRMERVPGQGPLRTWKNTLPTKAEGNKRKHRDSL